MARLATDSEYVAGTAEELAVALAMVVSPSVAVRPTSAAGVSRVVSVACSVSRALLNVPYADTWADSVAWRSAS